MRPLQRLLKGNLSLSSIGRSFDQGPFWANQMLGGSLVGDRERIEADFDSYVGAAYKANGIVFACVLARLMPFSEARFQFQRLTNGRPGDLFGDQSLSILENPWPNGTTGELLAHMEQDASLAGNFYGTIVGEGVNRRIRRLRPDWVTIITGVRGDAEASPFDLNAEVLGYIYAPPNRPGEGVLLTPDQVCHYSPIPDPVAQWRGMSWLTPVLDEIKADKATTKHKLKFFENGATANFVVTYEAGTSPEHFKEFVKIFEEQHNGVGNAYKTIHLGGGADATVVGADLKQLDFKATQGAGESRIAAAAGVGAIIARFSEGMQGSSLNTGNYGAAKRQFADMTLRPLWRTAAASLAKFVATPNESRLWYDDRDIEFLKEDAKDAQEIEALKAQTIRTYVDGGFNPESVVAAVDAQNITLLEHSRKLSVQLQAIDSDGSGLDANDIASLVQKVYLGVVNDVITPEEARAFLADSGFPISGDPPQTATEES